jgi:hypothetical protein
MMDLAVLEALLPSYARLDLAESALIPLVATGTTSEVTADTGEMLVVMQLTFRITTSAVVGVRSPFVRFDLKVPTSLYINIGSEVSQAAALTGYYTFGLQFGAAWFGPTIGGAFVAQTPLPLMVLDTKEKITLALLGEQAGDTLAVANAHALRIPTGPPRDDSRGPKSVQRFRELLGMRG